MDLLFNKTSYNPSKEFRGDLSRDIFNNLFGFSSRFIARLLFKDLKTLFEAVYKFVIDTGAFVSYAPDLILEALEIEPGFEGYIRGAAPQEECKIKIRVAKVPFKLIDDNNIESKELIGWFAFHSFDKGPFLLGMKDILEKCGILKKIDQDQLILQF